MLLLARPMLTSAMTMAHVSILVDSQRSGIDDPDCRAEPLAQHGTPLSG